MVNASLPLTTEKYQDRGFCISHPQIMARRYFSFRYLVLLVLIHEFQNLALRLLYTLYLVNQSLALLTRNIVKCSLQIIRPTPGNFISIYCTIYFNLNAYYLYMPWYGQKSTEITYQLFCSLYTVLQSI